MAIDFTFPDEVEDARLLVKRFMADVAKPKMAELSGRRASGDEWRTAIHELRQTARDQGLWAPHMPEEWGGMGLGITAVAAMSAEAVKTNMGPYLINCQAPDEGNMHTLLHFGTDEQKDKWLRGLCEGTMRSCFSMTEPEVAGSDPTQIQTAAVRDGDDWVINGHKWFTSGAHGATFAIVIAKTDPDAEIAQARNSAFIVPTDTPGFEIRSRHLHHGRRWRPPRDPLQRCARAARQHARRAGRRPQARASPLGSRALGALHALDRHHRAGA